MAENVPTGMMFGEIPAVSVVNDMTTAVKATEAAPVEVITAPAVVAASAAGLRAEATIGGASSSQPNIGSGFGLGAGLPTSGGNIAFGSIGGVAPVTVPVVPTQHPVTPSVKPHDFNGTGFNEWQPKMYFYLTTLHLVRYLSEECPKVSPDERDITTLAAVEAWKYGDYLCRNYILTSMVSNLYKVYKEEPTAKQLWASLEKEYKSENAGSKKHVIARFLDFKMVDSKTVTSQMHEMQFILHDLAAEGMTLNKTFSSACCD